MNQTPGKHKVIFWCLAIFGCLFDLSTKAYIFRLVGEPGSKPLSVVPNILELRTSYNTGALWGMGHNLPHSSLIFASLSIGACFLIVWWLFSQGAAKDFWLTVSLGLIMAGALGNCYDRLLYGHVRDFVHFHIDPIGFDCAIFNFADNMLVAGAIILMLLALKPIESPDQSNLQDTEVQPDSERNSTVADSATGTISS